MKCLSNQSYFVKFFMFEAIATKTNDAKVVVDFLKSNIFCRFGVPKFVISDQGNHFYNRAMSSLLDMYGVVHRIATAYHPYGEWNKCGGGTWRHCESGTVGKKSSVLRKRVDEKKRKERGCLFALDVEKAKLRTPQPIKKHLGLGEAVPARPAPSRTRPAP
ncbi:hypothetical protein CR513_25366, partial [Mucuna pruriens]